MERRGTGKRLTDGQRVEIIKLFDSGAAVTEADIARRYGVSRSAIWRLRRSSSHIMERYQEGDIESRDERRRGSLGSSSSSNRAHTAQFVAEAAAASAVRAATVATAKSEAEENEQIVVNVDALTAMTPGMTTAMQLTTNNGNAVVMSNSNSNGGGMMLGMVDQGAGSHGGGVVFVGGTTNTAAAGAAQTARGNLNTSSVSGAGPGTGAVSGTRALSSTPSSSPSAAGEVELIPGAVAPPSSGLEPALPLIYMSAKAIGSVQSPGVMNWERLNGYDDANHFLIVNDGISVVNEATYQINIDLEHSQPRQNYKCVFKVWNGKKLIGQCGCPLRTKKEISFSTFELRCKLQVHARLRVEFLAAGYAFHESRIVIRLVQ